MLEVNEADIEELRGRLDTLHEEVLREVPSEESLPELWRFLGASVTLSALGWTALIFLMWRLNAHGASGLDSGWLLLLASGGVCALALGTFSRWIAAHHLCHRGYDRARGLPRALRSDRFGQRGWAWLLWVDWMPTPAWIYEHNVRHHAYTNVPHSDPDLVEEKASWLRELKLPVPIKLLIFGIGALVWKPLYYGPNTLLELHRHQRVMSTPSTIYSWAAWSPTRAHVWRIATLSWAPYLLIHLALPLLLVDAIFGGASVGYASLYLVASEALTNMYSFIMIVPNHAGDDLYSFTDKSKSRGEYYMRQILSSCNYHTGRPLIDFLHGYLNYQIEHHLWPQLTMGQYRWLQPRVKGLCRELGIPYVQAPVWSRVSKLARLSVGLDHAPKLVSSPSILTQPNTPN